MEVIHKIGRRKTSVARVYMSEGKGDITVNKNMVPFDKKSPFITSGIRFGTPAITTRGVKEDTIPQIVELIDETITNYDKEFFRYQT